MVPRGPGLVLRGIPGDPLHQRRLPSTAVHRARHPVGRQGAHHRRVGHLEDCRQLVPVDLRDHRRHGRAPCVHGGHPEPRHPVHPQDAVVRGRGQRRDPRGAGGHAHDLRLQRRGASDPRHRGVVRPSEGQRGRGHQGHVLHAPPLGGDDELPDHGDILGRGGRHRPGLREHRGADGAVLRHDRVHILRHPGALGGDDDHRDPPAAAQRHGVVQEDRGRHNPRIGSQGRSPRGVRCHGAGRGEVRARRLHIPGN